MTNHRRYIKQGNALYRISETGFYVNKRPSMKRRMIGHDYTKRGRYLITLVVDGRRPLLGRLEGRADAIPGSPDFPRIIPTTLGQAVINELQGVPNYYPQIGLVACQLMPDHLHFILSIEEHLPENRPLGIVIRGFIQGCNRAYREELKAQGCLVPKFKDSFPPDNEGSLSLKDSAQMPRKSRFGLLFEHGYNDKILRREGQYEAWKHYLKDNPRRLLIKKQHADWFQVRRNVTFHGLTFSMIGNHFLLDCPEKLQVQCSRKITSEALSTQKQQLLEAAKRGAVLVSPSISKGEREIMHEAFKEGLRMIILKENGFTNYYKPSGRMFEACKEGRILLLSPWEHHTEQKTIARGQCLQLNDMARQLCL